MALVIKHYVQYAYMIFDGSHLFSYFCRSWNDHFRRNIWNSGEWFQKRRFLKFSLVMVCHAAWVKEVLAIWRIFSLVDMNPKTKISNCPNVFNIGLFR